MAPEHLRATGAAQDRVLAELGAGARTAVPATQTAAGGLPGWRTAERLAEIVTTWDRQVAALERRLGESATGLRGTADEYTRTETNVERSMGG
ncbi:type VII secretion target [Embleya sp. NPDC059259]|uniref:type VII secretion target n=1 Tax=unclassified Embleya TaxID=2699296 RepID=UPI0036C852A8